MKRTLKAQWKIAGGLILLCVALAPSGSAQNDGENSQGAAVEEAPAPDTPSAGEAVGPTEEAAPSPAENPAALSETAGPEEISSAPVEPPANRTDAAESAEAIPVQYGLYRYEPIWRNSPFMLETPLTTVVADSFAKDLAVTSVSTIEGRTRVGYVNTKTRAASSATNEEPNDAGILVASVQSDPDPSKVVVEFSQGGKTAKVSYDPMILQGKPTIPKPVATPRTVLPGGVPGARPPGIVAPTGQVPGGSPDRSAVTRRRIVLPKSVTGNQPAPAPAATLPSGLQQPPQGGQ